MRSLAVMAVLLGALGGGALFAQAPTRAVPKEFANVKKIGRALSEYQDKDIQVVAAYYYSQQNHNSAWLLIELGVQAWKAHKLERQNIELITPTGRVVPLATQERWGSQTERNVLLLQQVEPTRHQVGTYFKPTNGVENLRFFTAPAGTGTVLDFAQLRPETLVMGDLVFEAPTRLWDKGTHALVVRYSGGEVMLPIELQ